MEDMEPIVEDTPDVMSDAVSEGFGNALLMRRFNDRLTVAKDSGISDIGNAKFVTSTDVPKDSKLDGLGRFAKDFAVATGKELKGMVDPSNEDTFAPSRIIRGLASSAYNTVEGMGWAMKAIPSAAVRTAMNFAGLETSPELDNLLRNNAFSSLGDTLARYAGEKASEIEIKNPGAFDHYVSAMGFVASMWIPSAGVTKIATGLKYAKATAAMLGVATSTVIDSSLEAGFAYKECTDMGMSEDSSETKALQVFAANLPLNAITDALGGRFIPGNIFTKGANLKMSVVEAVQEGVQKLISSSIVHGALDWGGAAQEGFYAGLASLTLGQIVRFAAGKKISKNVNDMTQLAYDEAIAQVSQNKDLSPEAKRKMIKSIQANRKKFNARVVQAIKNQADITTDTEAKRSDKDVAPVNEAPDVVEVLQQSLKDRMAKLDADIKNAEDNIQDLDKAEQQVEKDIEKDMAEYDKVNKPAEPKAVESRYANQTDFINDTVDLLDTGDFGLNIKEREGIAEKIWNALDNEQAVNALHPKLIPMGRESTYSSKRSALMALAVDIANVNENIREGESQWADIKKAETNYAKQKIDYTKSLEAFDIKREAHLAKITKQAFAKLEADKGKAETELMNLVLEKSDVSLNFELTAFSDLIGEVEKNLGSKSLLTSYGRVKKFFNQVTNAHVAFLKKQSKYIRNETAFVQGYLKSVIDAAKLEPKSRVVFLSAITKVQTLEQLNVMLPVVKKKLSTKFDQDLTISIVNAAIKQFKSKTKKSNLSKYSYEYNTAYAAIRSAVRQSTVLIADRVGKLQKKINTLNDKLLSIPDQNSKEAIAIKQEILAKSSALQQAYSIPDIDTRMTDIETKAYTGDITVAESLEHATLRLMKMKGLPLGQSSPVEAYRIYNEITDYIALQKAESFDKAKEREAELAEKISIAYKDITGLDIKDVEAQFHQEELTKASMSTRTAGAMSNLVNFFTLVDMLSLRSDSKQEASNLYKICSVAENILQDKGGRADRLKNYENVYREVFGIKTEKEAMQKIKEDTREHELGSFTTGRGLVVSLKYSIAQARQFYAEMKNPQLRQVYTDSEVGMGFNPDMIEAIENLLSAKDRQWVERRIEWYKDYRETIINPVHKADFKIDMGFIDNYVPIERESENLAPVYDKFDDFLHEYQVRASYNPKNFLERTSNMIPLKKINDISKDTMYVYRMEHYMAFKQKMKEIRSIFEDPNVKNAIVTIFGNKMATQLATHLDDISRGHKKLMDAYPMIEKFKNNFVVKALAIKPKGLLAQLTAIPTFAERINNPAIFTKHLIGFFNPLTIAKNTKMMQDTVFYKFRGLDITKELHDVMRSKEFKAFAKKPTWINMLMLNVRMGDVGSFIVGGYAEYKSLLEQGTVKTHEEAIKTVSHDAALFMASGDIAYQSNFQKSGLFGELLTMFRSPDNAFWQRMLMSSLNLANTRTSPMQFAKVIALYGVLVPQLFTLIQNMFRWDRDDQLKALYLSPVRGWFIVEELVTAMVSVAMGNAGRSHMFLDTLYLEAGKAVSMVGKLLDEDEDFEREDVYQALRYIASTAATVTEKAAPLPFAVDAAWGVKKMIEEGDMAGAYLLGGYSPYQLKKREEALDEDEYVGIENLVELLGIATAGAADIMDEIF